MNAQPLAFNRVNRPYSPYSQCDFCGDSLQLPNGEAIRGLVANSDGWYCSQEHYIQHFFTAKEAERVQAWQSFVRACKWTLTAVAVVLVGLFIGRGI